MRRAILGITVGGLIAAAGTVGFFLSRQNTQLPQPTPIASPTPQATPTPDAGAAATQVIQDSAGLYSITLPADWQVSLEAARGVRVSGLTAQSPDYEVVIDNDAEGPFSPVSYKTGASLQITVTSEPLADNPAPAGQIVQQQPFVLDGVQGTFFVFKEPSTVEGELLELRLEKANRTYHLRWGYNPETLQSGRDLFESILESFRFLM